MKYDMQTWKVMALAGIWIFFPGFFPVKGQVYENKTNAKDSVSFSHRFIHRFGAEVRPGYIFPTSPFFKGENEQGEPIRSSLSVHLKYSFRFLHNTDIDRIYRGAYQGIGVAYYTFGERQHIGEPVAFYLFQGARIARLTSCLSFNYEWDFGASAGWKPYNDRDNSYNTVIGSKVNAYINVNFFLNWMLSRQFDLITGVALTHFSNGNTKFPNAGLNMIGLKVGLAYNFNRKDRFTPNPLYQAPVTEFPRHISYDLTLFGSWRRKGVVFGEGQVASPDAYTVLGFNFAPMYNIGYKFRAGISLDGVYDGSANVYTGDYHPAFSEDFIKPPPSKQLSLGLSGRMEYVMPYFTVGLGLGVNVLHAGGDLKALYQVLALKTAVTRNSFIHIGYCLRDFHDPNYLMLGIGFRFNNKYPTFGR